MLGHGCWLSGSEPGTRLLLFLPSLTRAADTSTCTDVFLLYKQPVNGVVKVRRVASRWCKAHAMQ